MGTPTICSLRSFSTFDQFSMTKLSRRTVQKQSALILPNLLEGGKCDHLIRAFHQYRHLQPPLNQAFPEGTVLWCGAMPARARSVKKIIEDLQAQCSGLIRKHYGIGGSLHCDGPMLIQWSVGPGMGLHADSSYADGAPNRTPWRQFTAVLNLDDQFIGGATVFPRLGLRVRPSRGQLIAFRANGIHEHSVDPILRGVRHTLAMWFSSPGARNVRRQD